MDKLIKDWDSSLHIVDVNKGLQENNNKLLAGMSDIHGMMHTEIGEASDRTANGLHLSESQILKNSFSEYRKGTIDNLKKQNKNSLNLFAKEPQLTKDQEASIELSYIAMQAHNLESKALKLNQTNQDVGTTTIGDVSTDFDGVLYDYASYVDQDDALLSRLNSRKYNSQSAIFQNQSALVGILPASSRGSISQSGEAPAYNLNQFSCGYFGERISIDVEKLMYARNVNQIDGFQSEYSQMRAYAQLILKFTQLMNLIPYKTKVDNGYNYMFSPYSDQGIGFMSYGRPTENIYTFGEPAFVKTASGEFEVNPDSKQFQQLLTWYSNQSNGVMRNLASLTEGLIVNLEGVNALTQQIIDNNNTPEAISFGAGLTYDFSPERLYNSVPWMKNMRIIGTDSMARLGTNDYGAINNVEYYMPTGYMLPVFKEYNGQNINGMFAFMPHERVCWLSNVQGVQSGATPFSDPECVGLRVINSNMDVSSNDPYVSIEIMAKMAFLNYTSAQDYMLKIFKDA